jgi:hypothetical protein
MPLQIGEKLDIARQRVLDGDEAFAEKVAQNALAAMFAGMGRFDRNGVIVEGTIEWETLMLNFTDEPQELARLCGKERLFNGSDYGLACIAYIAGDAPCTSHTGDTTGTKRTMMLQTERNMLENLDADLSDMPNFTGVDPTFTGF